MSKVKLYKKRGKVVIIAPGNRLYQFDPNNELQAVNGTDSDEVTIRKTENTSDFFLDINYANYVKADGTTTWGSDRATTVSNLNSELFDVGLDYQLGTGQVVYNDSGAAMSKGDPVIVKGITSGTITVELAKANDSTKMPAMYILDEDIADGNTGAAISMGLLKDFDTSSYSVKDRLYVAATGGLTDTAPTGSNIVQQVAVVQYPDASEGELLIQGLGNDLSNIPDIPLDVTTYTIGGDRTIDTGGYDLMIKDGVVPVFKYDDGDGHVHSQVPHRFSIKTGGGEARFMERSSNGTNYVALKAADALASDTTFTLPTADGSDEQLLQTDGSGALSFVTPKMKQVFNHSFIDNLSTGKHYLSWNDNNEQLYVYQEESAMYMPYDGRIESLTIRLASITGASSGTITIGVLTYHTGGTGAFGVANWTTEESEAVTVNPATDDHDAVHFVFDNAQHFEAGDMVALSIVCSTDLGGGTRYYWASSVVEFNPAGGSMPTTSGILTANP